jgi:NTE family protein
MPDQINTTRQDFLDAAAPYQARIAALKKNQYSDIVDGEGNQYIDLVLEGGGTLGIALLGYIYVLEQAGLRFIGIGGTSAGAVSAIALAAAGKPSESRLDKLMDELANMPMRSFVDGRKDGDSDAINVVDAWLNKRGALAKAWLTAQVLDNLHEIQALNRGDAFKNWMDQLLRRLNGEQPMTVASLRQRMNDLPDLWVCDSALADDFPIAALCPYTVQPDGRRQLNRRADKDQLCVISADISTESKIAFPRMANLYWSDPPSVNVAEFARASMSIPGFFATYKVPSRPVDDNIRGIWREAMPNWPEESLGGQFLPKVHHFVDGGVLSNFPIDAFHNSERVPLRPTFGVKLQWDEHNHDIQNLLDVFTQSFNSARHVLDGEFINRNPDFSKLVAYIDTKEIGWLDFGMDKATKLRLFDMGLQSAMDFLEQFDWSNYKRIRRLLLQANLTPA